MEIKTYPEMNETIKDLLRRSEEPMNLYIVARLEELEKQLVDKKFVGGSGDGSIEIIKPMPDNRDMALQPCPFCGSTNVVYERYNHKVGARWRCWCADCIAGIDPGYVQSWGTIAQMWNRRALPPNLPLTLDELREMDGEPVWISPAKGNGKVPARWMLISGYNLNKDIYLFAPSCNITQGYDGKSYGKTWLAYRRKPKEANNERNG